MDATECTWETSLEKYVRYGLAPESALPEGWRRRVAQTRAPLDEP